MKFEYYCYTYQSVLNSKVKYIVVTEKVTYFCWFFSFESRWVIRKTHIIPSNSSNFYTKVPELYVKLNSPELIMKLERLPK